MSDRAGVPVGVAQDPGTAAALVRAERRRQRQHLTLQPLGLVMLAVVLATTIAARPQPSLHGHGLALSLALLVYLAALGGLAAGPRRALPLPLRLGGLTAAAGAGLAIVILQSAGTAELAPSLVVAFTGLLLPQRWSWPLVISVTVGMDLALLGHSAPAVNLLTATLLCSLLALTGSSVRSARLAQERTELLLAELQAARRAEAEAVAEGERARITAEVHDVLAHSLSGLAIQLETARLLSQRPGVDRRLREAVMRSRELARRGLEETRMAVGTLKGGDVSRLDQLRALVDGFGVDLGVEATLEVEGQPRRLPRDADTALYRGIQEALTNVARHAPGSTAVVRLRYEEGSTRAVVEDRLEGRTGDAPGPLAEVGAGQGLEGMRRRFERAGGSSRAGPTAAGWLVEMEFPA